jgi:hypothetical protein
MAVPTVLTPVGVASGAIGAITPAKPVIAGGILADDVVIGIGETFAQAFPSIATNGFAHVDLSPVTNDTNTRLHIVWRRGDFTAHSWGDSGDHNLGAYIAIRGCKTTGNPWNTSASGFDSTLDNSAQWPAATTTVDECLMLFLAGWSDDFATGALSGGTGLGAFTERIDAGTATGNDGQIFCADATKLVAGSTGQPTATLAGNATKAMLTLALEPPPAAPAAELPILVMAPPLPG